MNWHANQSKYNTMKINIIRYHCKDLCVKGMFYVDGQPMGETREALPIGYRYKKRPILPAGLHRCLPCSTDCAAMTLKVCQKAGHNRLTFGWDALKQQQLGRILVGQACPTVPPDDRKLERQEETFAQLTQRIYQAYANQEDFELEVVEQYGE